MVDKSEPPHKPSQKNYTSEHARIRDQYRSQINQIPAEIQAISLCQSVVEQLPRVFTEDKEKLSCSSLVIFHLLATFSAVIPI